MHFKTKTQFATIIVFNRLCSQISLKTLCQKEYSLICPIWKIFNNDPEENSGVYQKQVIKDHVNLKSTEHYFQSNRYALVWYVLNVSRLTHKTHITFMSKQVTFSGEMRFKEILIGDMKIFFHRKTRCDLWREITFLIYQYEELISPQW